MTDSVRLQSDDVVEINPMYLYRWEEPQQAHVLLYPEGVVKLNETAAAILGHCRDSQPVSAVVDALVTLYGTHEVEDDVRDFLHTALDKGWIRVKR